MQEVREKNINSEKLDSIYSDVGKAKQFVKWYLIIAGSIGAAVLVLMVVLRHQRPSWGGNHLS